MKFAIAVLSVLCFAYVQAQNPLEMMFMSQLLGRGGSSSSGSGASSSNPLAALTGSGSGGSGGLSSMGSGSASSNPLSSLMSGGMGRMASGMMLGGADMSSMMVLYTCGQANVPMFVCMSMMQQNM